MSAYLLCTLPVSEHFVLLSDDLALSSGMGASGRLVRSTVGCDYPVIIANSVESLKEDTAFEPSATRE